MPRLRIALTAGALLCALFAVSGPSAAADELKEIERLHSQEKQPDKALERLEGYLAQQPRDARARFLKGVILASQKRTGDAIGVFTALTEDYPELPEPYNNLAVLHAAQGHYDKARLALEMAINARPGYATAHENLGDIYAKMASQAYERALQLDQGDAAAQAKLTLLKELLSRTPLNPISPTQKD